MSDKSENLIFDIYKEEQVFHDSFQYFCYKNCYLNILRYYKVKNPEFYINYSLDWIFLKNDDLKWGFDFKIGNINDNLLSPFDKKILKVDKTIKSCDEIWQSDIEYLKQDIPVVVAVDVYYLKYTPYYYKKHSIHSIIIAGYEEENDKIYVIDWYPSWYFKGEITKNELDMARNSLNDHDGILSGIPINYQSSVICRSDFSEDEIKLIKNQLEKTLNKFYQVNSDKNAVKGELNGYRAINEISVFLEDNMSLKGQKRVKFLEYMYEKLYFIYSRKELFYWFLERVEDEYPIISVRNTQDALEKTMKSWKIILSLIIKCTIKNTNDDYEKILIIMEQIMAEEKRFYYSLYDLNRRVNLIT